jgi:transcriptional regulator with XRE-family HTH domain
MVSKADIGALMRARRRRLGLSQEEVAKRISTSRPNYTNWELGKIEVSAFDLQRVAQVLEVPMTYFFPQDRDEWAPEGETAAFYSGFPPDVEPVVRAMVEAAQKEVERSRTTHGRKAE